MDYFYGGETDRKTATNPMLVVMDKHSGHISGYGVESNGVDDWLPRQIAEDLDTWGWSGREIILKYVGEQIIVVLIKQVAGLHPGVGYQKLHQWERVRAGA